MKRGRGRPRKIVEEKLDVQADKKVKMSDKHKKEKLMNEVRKDLQANTVEIQNFKDVVCSEIKNLQEIVTRGSPANAQIFIVNADSYFNPTKIIESSDVVDDIKLSFEDLASDMKNVKSESALNDFKTETHSFKQEKPKPKPLKKFRPPISKYRLKEMEAVSTKTAENPDSEKLSPSKSVTASAPAVSKFLLMNAWLARTSPEHCVKNSISLQKMLTKPSLISTFKCLSQSCSYTTLSQRNFQRHLKLHEEENGSEFLLFCPYCLFKGESSSELLNHYTEHAHDKYQCGYCFYRSASSSSCWEHVKTHHSREPFIIYECPLENSKVFDVEQRVELSRSKHVHPLKCSSKKRTKFFKAR